MENFKNIAMGIVIAAGISIPLGSIIYGTNGDRELAEFEELGSCDYLKKQLMQSFKNANSDAAWDSKLAYRNAGDSQTNIVLPQVQTVTISTYDDENCTFSVPSF